MTDKDYPAQHSMDTQWYAVDDCGHVAACYSSESGAIPTNATTDSVDKYVFRSEEDDTYDWTHRHAVLTVDPKYVDVLQGVHRTHYANPLGKDHHAMGAFMILRRLPENLRKIVDQGGEEAIYSDKAIKPTYRILKDGRALVLICAGLQPGFSYHRFAALVHQKGLCVSCASYYSIDSVRLGTTKKDAKPIFYYKHPGANGAPYPYFLSYVPEDAPTIDELPISEEAIVSAKRVRLSGCFKERIFWQPTETHVCELYGDGRDEIFRPEGADFQGLLQSVWGYL